MDSLQIWLLGRTITYRAFSTQPAIITAFSIVLGVSIIICHYCDDCFAKYSSCQIDFYQNAFQSRALMK